MASVKLEIKAALSVVVMILDNGPSDRGSIPREIRIFLKKVINGSAKQAEELTKSSFMVR